MGGVKASSTAGTGTADRAAGPTGGAILTVAKHFGNEYDFNGPLDGSLFFIVSTKTND